MESESLFDAVSDILRDLEVSPLDERTLFFFGCSVPLAFEIDSPSFCFGRGGSKPGRARFACGIMEKRVCVLIYSADLAI